MAKYKAVKKKQDLPPQMRQGVPCLVIVIVVMVLIVFAMYFAMKNAG
jgi:heme/copper-type cytochrome/quinol oxidase subunit 2